VKLCEEDSGRIVCACIAGNEELLADLCTCNYVDVRTGLRGGPTALLLKAPTYKRCLDVTGIIINMVLVNSDFPHMRKFPENYLHFGCASSKMFASPVLGQKSSKNIGLKGCLH